MAGFFPGVPKGWTEHRFESLGSTMDAARDMAETGAPDRTLVRADSQTCGRGRCGRPWISEPGNLNMTAILYEARPLSDCAQLSFVAALALADAIGHSGVTLKWPNDVLLGGAKTAGILLEGGGTAPRPWTLLGIGVNVAHYPAGTSYPATCLAKMGIATDPDALCRAFLEALDRWRGIWHRNGAQTLHDAWLDRAQGRGGPIGIRLKDRSVDGIFDGLDADGRLIVTDRSGTRHAISTGDVFFG